MFNRHFSAVAALSLMLHIPVTAKDAGFFGKWVLEKNSSTATADIPDKLVQDFKKKGDDVLIVTEFREPANGIVPLAFLGVMATEVRLGLGGEERTNEIGPFKQVSKTTNSGNEMVTEWTAVVNGETVTGQWKRTLSDDGKQMVLTIDQKCPDGKNNSARLQFKRK